MQNTHQTAWIWSQAPLCITPCVILQYGFLTGIQSSPKRGTGFLGGVITFTPSVYIRHRHTHTHTVCSKISLEGTIFSLLESLKTHQRRRDLSDSFEKYCLDRTLTHSVSYLQVRVQSGLMGQVRVIPVCQKCHPRPSMMYRLQLQMYRLQLWQWPSLGEKQIQIQILICLKRCNSLIRKSDLQI